MPRKKRSGTPGSKKNGDDWAASLPKTVASWDKLWESEEDSSKACFVALFRRIGPTVPHDERFALANEGAQECCEKGKEYYERDGKKSAWKNLRNFISKKSRFLRSQYYEEVKKQKVIAKVRRRKSEETIELQLLPIEDKEGKLAEYVADTQFKAWQQIKKNSLEHMHDDIDAILAELEIDERVAIEYVIMRGMSARTARRKFFPEIEENSFYKFIDKVTKKLDKELRKLRAEQEIPGV